MAWSIELTPIAKKGLKKLSPQNAQRILNFLFNRLANLDDPRLIGEALKGSELSGFWKYRVGDYRIISEIKDDIVRILVVKVGHRREVYR